MSKPRHQPTSTHTAQDRARTQRLSYALLEEVTSGSTNARIFVPSLVIFQALILLHWFSISAVAAWLAFVTLGSVGIHLTIIRRNWVVGSVTYKQAVLESVVAAVASAVPWASMGLLFWVPGDHLNHLMIFMFCGLNISIFTITCGICRPVFLATIAPFALVWLLRLAFHTESFQPELLLFTAAFLITIVAVASDAQKNAKKRFELLDENAALVKRLGETAARAGAAQEQAEEASKAKTTFLANMSHEIRTPLNAILGFAEVMRDELLGKMGNPRYQGYAADIHKSGTFLLDLINDILDVSRIEAGKLSLSPSRIEIDPLFGSILSLFILNAKEAGVTLDRRVLHQIPDLFADEKTVRQVLINLIANAIRFTPSGGRVTLSADLASDGGIVLRVEDTGIGIPEDQLERVLESFVQGDQVEKLRERGTGLGLTIVKGLVELHGGKFILRSQVGAGTRAEARFPPERTIAVEPTHCKVVA